MAKAQRLPSLLRARTRALMWACRRLPDVPLCLMEQEGEKFVDIARYWAYKINIPVMN